MKDLIIIGLIIIIIALALIYVIRKKKQGVNVSVAPMQRIVQKNPLTVVAPANRIKTIRCSCFENAVYLFNYAIEKRKLV